MGVQIQDGTGAGFQAGVTSSNRLDVSARANTRAYYISRDSGQLYSWTSLTYNYAGGDTILLVKNTSDVLNLHIEEIQISGDTTMKVFVHLPVAEVTPTSATTVVGTNLNTTSSNVAPATGKTTETDNTLGDIITSVSVIADETFVVDYNGEVILGKNKSIGVDFVTVGGACAVTLIGYFE